MISNEREAMQEITDHLLALGHTEIAMITGPHEYCSSQERMEGFLEALAKADITIDSNWLIEGKNSYESGLECAKKLLSASPRPTAIFANNDEMAAGVIRIANDMGIVVPEQLSVVGFDDNLYASRIIPSLTTMKRPVEKLADIATRKLINAFQSNSFPANLETTIKPYLIKRESSAPCTEGD